MCLFTFLLVCYISFLSPLPLASLFSPSLPLLPSFLSNIPLSFLHSFLHSFLLSSLHNYYYTYVHRYCGYILESSARSRRQSEKRFLFHGFKMEPNTDKLCLALHTACQTRYQKVLESNPEAQTAAREKAEVRKGQRYETYLTHVASFRPCFDKSKEEIFDKSLA